MTLKKALSILEDYQSWRMGEHDDMLEPKLVTGALMFAIRELRKLTNK